MLTARMRGFSLIELMVTLSLLAVLLAAGAPSFGTWIANANVRSAAESIQNGLRLAQTEAVRRNRQVAFVLTNGTPAWDATPVDDGTGWFIRVIPATGETADAQFFVQGNTYARQNAVSIDGPAATCFNSVGRQVSNDSTGLGADCTAPADATEVTEYAVSRASGADRRMRVQVYLGGQVRMCDPDKDRSTQPDGC